MFIKLVAGFLEGGLELGAAVERRVVLDDVDTITAYAKAMREFLRTSELTESRTFIRSFVKEVAVAPGTAVIRYSIPMPRDSRIRGRTPRRWPLRAGTVYFTLWWTWRDSNPRPPQCH